VSIRILIADDEELVRESIAQFLEHFGYATDVADSCESAWDRLRSENYDVVVTDKNMPGSDGGREGGMELLRLVKRHQPGAEVIMVTGYGSIDTAIEAMKNGAFDYILKPISPVCLKEKIERIRDYKSYLNPENTVLFYKRIHNQILGLLEGHSALADLDSHEALKEIETTLDRLFTIQKQYESILLLQKEALGRIAALSEELREAVETLPEVDDATALLVQRICDEASRRI